MACTLIVMAFESDTIEVSERRGSGRAEEALGRAFPARSSSFGKVHVNASELHYCSGTGTYSVSGTQEHHDASSLPPTSTEATQLQ